MNRDELAAVAALQRNLGWKILSREFSRRRESVVMLCLNPDTPLDEVERQRRWLAGIEEVLGWPARQLTLEPVEDPIRAGYMQQPPEEE